MGIFYTPHFGGWNYQSARVLLLLRPPLKIASYETVPADPKWHITVGWEMFSLLPSSHSRSQIHKWRKGSEKKRYKPFHREIHFFFVRLRTLTAILHDVKGFGVSLLFSLFSHLFLFLLLWAAGARFPSSNTTCHERFAYHRLPSPSDPFRVMAMVSSATHTHTHSHTHVLRKVLLLIFSFLTGIVVELPCRVLKSTPKRTHNHLTRLLLPVGSRKTVLQTRSVRFGQVGQVRLPVSVSAVITPRRRRWWWFSRMFCWFSLNVHFRKLHFSWKERNGARWQGARDAKRDSKRQQKRVREKTAPHAPDSPLKMLKRKGENCKKRECWAHQMEDSRITNFGSFCVAVCLVASLLSNLSCNFANVKKSLPPQIYSYQCLRIWGLALLFASAMLPNTCGGFALVLENRFSLQNKLFSLQIVFIWMHFSCFFFFKYFYIKHKYMKNGFQRH